MCIVRTRHKFINIAGIYYAYDSSDASRNINLIGANSICVELGTSDLSCYGIFDGYGIFDDDYSQGLKITGNGSLTVQSGDAISGDRYTSWSMGIFARDKIIVGADCTITATSGTADISAAIFSYNGLTATNSKVTAGDSADSANAVDITSDDFDLDNYKYMKIEPASIQTGHTHNLTPVSENPATCTMLNVHNGLDRYEHSFLCTSVFSMYRSRVSCSFFVMLLSPLVYTKPRLLALYPL